MKLTLLQPHRHNGIDLPRGATLDLRDNLAVWLISHGIATKAGKVEPRKQPFIKDRKPLNS